jgi:prevent-host-death family protein
METDGINTVTAQQMRDQLSDLLNRAAYLREPTLVTRQGKAVAVLVSVGEWEEYLQMKAAAEKSQTEAVGQTAESGQEDAGSGNGRE